MTNRCKSIIYAIMGVVLVYLVGAYTAWDFNSANWDPAGRFFIGLVSFIAAVVFYTINEESND